MTLTDTTTNTNMQNVEEKKETEGGRQSLAGDLQSVSLCLCVLTQLTNLLCPPPLLPAEKRQDALPDRGHHQLPGSLHLHGGAAHRLLPLPLSKVGVVFFLSFLRPVPRGCRARRGGGISGGGGGGT